MSKNAVNFDTAPVRIDRILIVSLHLKYTYNPTFEDESDYSWHKILELELDQE